MPILFSVVDRHKFISRLKSEHFDLLVVGGGITGAGIALDAASRGLSVALVEKNDFAFGTSSRSTKLIHGGLRYLKQLEFGLVKEVGSERAVVHKLAPHLVIPDKMLLPLTEGQTLGYWITSIGLKIYDWLAGVRKEDQRKMLTRNQTLRLEPLLKKKGLKGGAIYAEYRTDDARLTLEIVKTAFSYGVVALNYLRVDDFIYQEGKVQGAHCVDELSGNSLTIQASLVVNATGPWVDELRTMDKSRTGKRLHLTKGVHIVVAAEALPVQQAIYFETGDGRMIFAIPRGRVTYIGTTDTNYTGDKNVVHATRDDVEYLITAVNRMFQGVNLTIASVESSWAGLRPLIHEEGKSASELSRKDEIFESPSGLISIAGGKLTGYRKMAERVVDHVVKEYFNSKHLKKCYTNSIQLTQAPFPSTKEVNRYADLLSKKIKSVGLDPKVARYLVENYGSQSDDILKYFDRYHGSQSNPDLSLLKAELEFSLNNEMIVNVQDFFVRRTGLLYFNIEKVIKWKNEITGKLSEFLGWTEAEKQQELDALEKLIQHVRNFN